MRSLLTMLGIIIGISAVIAIMTVGSSLSNAISGSMQNLGANNINIYLQSKESEGPRMMVIGPGGGGFSEKDLITEDMLTALREEFPDEIEALSISDGIGSGQTTQGKRYANLSLVGVNTEYLRMENLSLTRGRFLNEEDMQKTRKLAVVSDKLAVKMFGAQEPLGREIIVTAGSHTDTYTIIGVYEYKEDGMLLGASSANDEDIETTVYIPLSTANKVTGSRGYTNLSLLTAVSVDANAFSDDVTRFFNRY
jgi:putative ABC transport system permease protein